MRGGTGREGHAVAAVGKPDADAAIGIDLAEATGQDAVRVIAGARHKVLASLIVIIPRTPPIAGLVARPAAPPIGRVDVIPVGPPSSALAAIGAARIPPIGK